MEGEEIIEYMTMNKVSVIYRDTVQFRALCRVLKIDIGQQPFVVPGAIAVSSTEVEVRIPVSSFVNVVVSAVHIVLPLNHPYWSKRGYTMIEFDDFSFLYNPLEQNIFQ